VLGDWRSGDDASDVHGLLSFHGDSSGAMQTLYSALILKAQKSEKLAHVSPVMGLIALPVGDGGLPLQNPCLASTFNPNRDPWLDCR
jgi:hypothetical protein